MSAAPLAAQSASAARPRGWWPWVAWAAVLALLAMFGWAGWRAYDERAAVREVEALGFQLLESASPSDHIRADWHAAFRLATWREHGRGLDLPEGTDLAPLRPLLLRLDPTFLFAERCRNVDALRGLTRLRVLILSDSDVQDLAPLASLTQLERLTLSGCTGVTDLAPLAGLAHLCVDDCTGVADLSPLGTLAQLMELSLNRCTGLSAEVVEAFKKGHPQVAVFGP